MSPVAVDKEKVYGGFAKERSLKFRMKELNEWEKMKVVMLKMNCRVAVKEIVTDGKIVSEWV